MAGVEFFNKVAALAEEEGHHPDLHLEGYRQLAVELWTHAIGGLSENDFILAAKINQIPIQLKGANGFLSHRPSQEPIRRSRPCRGGRAVRVTEGSGAPSCRSGPLPWNRIRRS